MKAYQKVLGVILPPKLSWNPQSGPSKRLVMKYLSKVGVDPNVFTHMLVQGSTGSGKGVFCSSLGLYMRDNFGWSFIDFNDPDGNYENGYYRWPQDDPDMLARLSDTFFYNTPHGYKTTMHFPEGTLDKYPSFFEPFSISYRDLKAFDFKQFFLKNDPVGEVELDNAIIESKDIHDFVAKLKKSPAKGAYPILKEMAAKGYLTDETFETTFDYKELANPRRVHSFSMASVSDRRVQSFTTSTVVRMIYDSRFGKNYKPCSFYVREAGTLDDTVARMMATRGRHAGVHFIADTQRRVSMMDKTVGLQFSSQALFRMQFGQALDCLQSLGLDERMANGLIRAQQGVSLLNFVGSRKPIWPVAISPPVTQYKKPNTNYFRHCKEMGEDFITL